MAFQVIADYDSINEVVKKIKKTTADYNDVINTINKEFLPVQSSSVWAGVDTSAYKTSFNSYIKELKQIGVLYETLSTYIEEIARRYKEIDEECGIFTVFEPVLYDSPIDDEPIYEEATYTPLYEPEVKSTPIHNPSTTSDDPDLAASSLISSTYGYDPTGKKRWEAYREKMQHDTHKPTGGN